jgi:hypothetical protein
VDGRTLRFRLGGINNQNFLMFDEETGSWWQQITGECLLGPLKGKRLQRIFSDEVTLAVWRREHPESEAVRFDPKHKNGYAPPDWERRISRLPVTVPLDPSSPLAPRDLVVGIDLDGRAVAFPLPILRRQSPVNTQLGARPILVAIAADGNSVRSFVRQVDGKVLDFYRKPDVAVFTLIDSATGSEWDFSGRATLGPLAGRSLERVQNITEYWFDWKRYHPATTVYRAGESIRRN